MRLSVITLFMQVLGLLAKCHARGIALRRVRPSQLRVTAAGAVFADTLPAPPAEIALYAAPEELGLTSPAQSWSSTAPAPVAPALAQLAISGSLAVVGGVAPPQTAVGAATMSAMAADMFSLGILFFELFHPIAGGAAERARTLGELRHRILPMDLLQVMTVCFLVVLHLLTCVMPRQAYAHSSAVLSHGSRTLQSRSSEGHCIRCAIHRLLIRARVSTADATPGGDLPGVTSPAPARGAAIC